MLFQRMIESIRKLLVGRQNVEKILSDWNDCRKKSKLNTLRVEGVAGGSGDGELSRRDLGLVENLAQFAFGAIEHGLLPLGQAFAAAVNVKIEHGHSGLKWCGLSSAAALRRALQRESNLVRIGVPEYPRFEVQRVAVAHYLRRPSVS